MLLHWLGYRSWPFTGTGSNGLPVATMARPSDQAYASAAVSSAEDVGLESGLSRANYMHSDAASQGGGWWQGCGAAYKSNSSAACRS